MKKLLSIALCFVLLFSLASCTPDLPQADKTIVMTSFYPMYIFTQNLLKGIPDIHVQNMTQTQGGCLHDYQLMPQDMKYLYGAKTFVINGAGMETFLEDVAKQNENLTIIDSSINIPLLASHHAHEENDVHEEEEQEEHHNDDGHNHGEHNAHIWMSVSNAITQVKNIAHGLIDVFPEYKAQILANKDAYIATLTALRTEIAQKLTPIKGKHILSFHEAYDYFAQAFGLHVVATVESDEGAQPGTKELTQLVDLIKDEDISAIFVEPFYIGSSADILAKETSIKVFVVNPMTYGEGHIDDYQKIMIENANIFLEALS